MTMVLFPPENLSSGKIYKILTTLIVPRPIAWVTSQKKPGTEVNLAPFSYFNAVCSDPPMLILSLGYQTDGTKKDTLQNIESSGEFVVHPVPLEMGQSMVETSRHFPPSVGEAETLGIKLSPSERVSIPRLALTPYCLECSLEKVIPLGDPPTGASLILGKIIFIQINSNLLDEKGRIKGEQISPLGRLGGNSYCKTDSPIDFFIK